MPEWLETSSSLLLFGVMLVGLFGLIIPIFPGGVIIWLAALGYGLLNGFGTAGTIIFIVITLLMIASALSDNLLMGANARREGASWWSIIIALVAGALLTFIAPPFGGLIAAPIALYLAEYLRQRDPDQAMQVTRGLLVGCGWAFFVRFGLGAAKIGLWVIWAWGKFE
jgi:hypothetical protein